MPARLRDYSRVTILTNLLLPRQISTIANHNIRTVDASGLVNFFVAQVRSTTYERDKEVKAGRVTWDKTSQLRDDAAIRLGALCRQYITDSLNPKKKEFLDAVESYKKDQSSVLIIKGLAVRKIKLPQDFNPRDPKEYDRPDFRTKCAILSSFAFGPLGLEFVHHESFHRIRAITPIRSSPRVSFDTTEELAVHSDGYAGSGDKIANHTTILCVNSDPEISTGFIEGKDIFAKVSDKYKNVLLGKNFHCPLKNQFGHITSEPFAIFTKQENGIMGIRYGELHTIQGITLQAREALQHLKPIIQKEKENAPRVVLESGDFCTFRNSRLIHFRTAAPEDSQRLLFRADFNNRENAPSR